MSWVIWLLFPLHDQWIAWVESVYQHLATNHLQLVAGFAYQLLDLVWLGQVGVGSKSVACPLHEVAAKVVRRKLGTFSKHLVIERQHHRPCASAACHCLVRSREPNSKFPENDNMDTKSVGMQTNLSVSVSVSASHSQHKQRQPGALP